MNKLSLAIRVDDEIELRLNELHHAAAYHALIQRNLEHLHAWMPWATEEQTLEAIRAYIEGAMQQFVRGASLPTVLWYRGKLAGSVGYPRMSTQKSMAEIGYWLDKDIQGKGIITRAASALISYAFEEYGLNKVEIHAATGNTRSRAVAERLGLTQEGIIRQIEWLHGKPHDLVIYGVLASEWQPRKS